MTFFIIQYISIFEYSNITGFKVRGSWTGVKTGGTWIRNKAGDRKVTGQFLGGPQFPPPYLYPYAYKFFSHFDPFSKRRGLKETFQYPMYNPPQL